MGRQPWVVQGLLKTPNAVSPSVSAWEVGMTLAGFTLLYGVLAVVDGWLMFRYAKNVPPPAERRQAAAGSRQPRDGLLGDHDDAYRLLAPQTFWFALIAILWIGYFVLEGFDFGVGTLLPFLAKDDTDRRVMINTIGPVWDGNEVWLIVAGGATFAAFPGWYATLFSGFYLAFFLILVALIVRGVAFEYRGKHDSPRWRAWWDRAIFLGSALPALLWGVGFGNIVQGVPINAAGEYTGNFFTLLNPYALVAGVTSLALFTLHGAVYLSLKTTR